MTLTPRQAIIAQVQALLALADGVGGATAGEQANAAAMAQAKILKHRVEEQELANTEGRHLLPGIEKVDGGNYKQGQLWIIRLMEAIGRPVTVDVINHPRDGSCRVDLVGRPDMIAYVEVLRNWIVPQIERLCSEELAMYRYDVEYSGHVYKPGHTIKFKRSFYLGAVETIGKRLEWAARQNVKGTALVLSDRAHIDDFFEKNDMNIKNYRINVSPLEYAGMAAGKEAGNRVDIDPNNKVSQTAHQELSCA